MSKNIQKRKNNTATATQPTQLAQALSQANVTPATVAAPRQLLTNTGLAYLRVAMDKAAEPIHPNFRAKLKPDTLAFYEHVRVQAARALDAHPDNIRAAIVATGKVLKDDVRAYVQFFKDLAGAAAFAAHMDCVRLTRSVDPEALDAGLDAMGVAHAITDDIPPFDVGDAQRAAPREDYAGAEDFTVFATSVQDAYEAIEGVQAWIGLAVTNMPLDSQAYWGVDGLFPLGQRVDEHATFGKVYAPLRDFDAYRAYQDETWKRKSRRVEVKPDVEAAMLGG